MATWGPPIEHGRFNAPFGEMRDNGPHLGTDIGPPVIGQRVPVYSMGPGVVLLTGNTPIRGHWVLIQHDDGTYSRYQHFNTPATVAVGTRVSAGTAVGICGDLGTNVTGVHLHLETYPVGPNPGETQNGAMNPETWASVRGIDLHDLGALPNITDPTIPQEPDMPLNQSDLEAIDRVIASQLDARLRTRATDRVPPETAGVLISQGGKEELDRMIATRMDERFNLIFDKLGITH